MGIAQAFLLGERRRRPRGGHRGQWLAAPQRREQLGLTAAVVGKTTRIGGTNLSAIESGRRRLARQARLDGAAPLRVSAVIHQAARLQEVGGRAVLARHFVHLTDVIEGKQDHVEVRVMPSSAAAHPLIGYPMTILSFDSPRLPDLLWQETISSQAIIDHRDTLREYAASFDAAMNQALSREDSLALIQRTRKETV